jgi:hypothetical protein
LQTIRLCADGAAPDDAVTVQLKAALAAYRDKYPRGYAPALAAAEAVAEQPTDGGGDDDGDDEKDGSDDFSDWDEDEDDGATSSAASNRRGSFSFNDDVAAMHSEIALLWTTLKVEDGTHCS